MFGIKKYFPVILFLAITSSGCALQTMDNRAIAVYPYYGSEFLNETDNLNVGPLFKEYEIGFVFQDQMLKNFFAGGVDTSSLASRDAQVEIIRDGALQRIILFSPDQPVSNASIAPTLDSAGEARLARMEAYYQEEQENMSFQEKEIHLSTMESQMSINQAIGRMNAAANLAASATDAAQQYSVSQEKMQGTFTLAQTISETNALDINEGEIEKISFLLYAIAPESEMVGSMAFTLFGGTLEAKMLYGIKAELDMKNGVKARINRNLAMTQIIGGYSDHTEIEAPYKIIKLVGGSERHNRPPSHLVFKILSRLIIKDIAFMLKNKEQFGL